MRDLFPNGSVVLLKDANKKIMIVGRFLKQAETDKTWDYIGCPFPEGMLAIDKNLLFDHSQIASVYFIGFQDREEILYKYALLKAEEQQIAPKS